MRRFVNQRVAKFLCIVERRIFDMYITVCRIRVSGVPVTVEEVERSGRTAVHGAASLGHFDFRRRAGERTAQLVLRDFFGRGLRKLRHDV